MKLPPTPRLRRTSRRKWVVTLLVLCVSVVMQVGCATVRGTTPVNIDQSSPQSLARSLHEASVNGNYAAMLECMEPAYQGLYDEFLVALKGVRQKTDMLVAVVWEKFGYEQAERVRRTWNFPISPFVSITKDGRVDWNKVRFLHPKDNMAYIWIVDDGRMKLRKIGTRWFIAGDTEGYVCHLNDEMKSGYRQAAPEYQKLIDRIRKGEISEGDLAKELRLDELELEAANLKKSPLVPWGKSAGGVRIGVSPHGESFRAGEPLMFNLGIRYETRAPICFRLPDDGVGENVVVEIDGKVVSLPFHKANRVIGGNINSVACDGVLVTLPESVRLKPGKHVLRYTIISRKGTYVDRDGNKIPILGGKLISNITTFVVE